MKPWPIHITDVREGGVIGDGITDNYAKLQALLDGGARHLFFPPASSYYRTTKPVYIPSDCTIEHAQGAVVRNDSPDLTANGSCLGYMLGNYESSDDNPQWLTGVAYILGDRVKNSGQNYIATNTATSGGTPPTGTGSPSDGGVTWRRVSAVAGTPSSIWGCGTFYAADAGIKGLLTLTLSSMQWASGTDYAQNEHVTNAGKEYRAQNTGTSGATAPTHSSGTASDDTVVWLYVGVAATAVSHFTAGDVISIRSDAKLYAPPDAIVYESYLTNELNVVEAVDGAAGTITLRRPLDQLYSPCRVRVLNGKDMTGATDQFGRPFQAVRDVNLINCQLEQTIGDTTPSSVFTMFLFSGAIDIDITGMRSEHANGGLAINAWCHVRMKHCRLRVRCRGVELAYGVHNWTLEDCKFSHDDTGSPSAQYALTISATTRHVDLDNVELDTNLATTSAVVIAGPCDDIRFRHCKLRGTAMTGQIVSVGLASEDVSPTNVSLDDCTIEGAAGTDYGVYWAAGATTPGSGHRVSGCTFIGLQLADVYVAAGVTDSTITDDNRHSKGVVLENAASANVNTIPAKWLSPSIEQGKLAARFTRVITSMADSTAVVLARISMEPQSSLGVSVTYHLFRALNASRNGALCGLASYAVLADADGNITAAAKDFGMADAKGGEYASFTVAVDTAVDTGANTADIRLTQTNDHADAMHGVFTFTFMGGDNASNSIFDPSRVDLTV